MLSVCALAALASPCEAVGPPGRMGPEGAFINDEPPRPSGRGAVGLPVCLVEGGGRAGLSPPQKATLPPEHLVAEHLTAAPRHRVSVTPAGAPLTLIKAMPSRLNASDSFLQRSCPQCRGSRREISQRPHRHRCRLAAVQRYRHGLVRTVLFTNGAATSMLRPYKLCPQRSATSRIKWQRLSLPTPRPPDSSLSN
jgi:hypothetical protein